MGLECGIVMLLPEDNGTSNIGINANTCRACFDGKSYNRYELCYWRKCYGMTNYISRYIDIGTKPTQFLTLEDIPPIIDILSMFLDKDYYEEHNDSFWGYDEIKDEIKKQISNLTKAEEFLSGLDKSDYVLYYYNSF